MKYFLLFLFCLILGCRTIEDDSRNWMQKTFIPKTEKRQIAESKSSYVDTKSKLLLLLQIFVALSSLALVVSFFALYFRFPIAGDLFILSSVMFCCSLCSALFFDLIIWFFSILFVFILLYLGYLVYTKFKSNQLTRFLVNSFEVQKEFKWQSGGRKAVTAIEKPLWMDYEIKKHKYKYKYDILKSQGRIRN